MALTPSLYGVYLYNITRIVVQTFVSAHLVAITRANSRSHRVVETEIKSTLHAPNLHCSPVLIDIFEATKKKDGKLNLGTERNLQSDNMIH